VTPHQVALAWSVRSPGVQAIPKSANPARVRQNVDAADVQLSADDLRAIDAAYPPPGGPVALETA
jgi:diketogulonate reductase-like aldo/keto reductase